MTKLSFLLTTWLVASQALAQSETPSPAPAAPAPAAPTPTAPAPPEAAAAPTPAPAPSEAAPAAAASGSAPATPAAPAKAPPLLLEAEASPAPALEAPKPLDPALVAPAPASEATPPAVAKPALPPPTAPRLLVMNIADKGGGPDVAAAVSAAVASQAIQSHPGEVVSAEQIKVTLDAAALQALVGCESADCMTDVANQVEAKRVLGGNVARVMDDVVLTLLVVEVATGARVAELTRKIPAHEDMYYYAAREMTSLVLTGKATDSLVPVRVEASQPGARVIVDGQVRGTAPTTLKLDPGSHEVRVEKDGFASWRTLADVQEATPLALTADLVAERLPLWPAALVVGGVSLGATAGALWTGSVALERYDGSVSPALPEALRWLIPGELGPQASYRHGEPTDTLTLAQRKIDVETWRLTSNVLWGTAGVLLLSAVALETADVVLGATE